MKHIKYKKVFETTQSQAEEVDNTLKDICLELSDEGFVVSLYMPTDSSELINNTVGTRLSGCRTLVIALDPSYYGKDDTISYLKASSDSFRYSRVEETINRLLDYLGDMFISLEVSVNRGTGRGTRNIHEWIELVTYKNRPDHLHLKNTAVLNRINMVKLFYDI